MKNTRALCLFRGSSAHQHPINAATNRPLDGGGDVRASASRSWRIFCSPTGPYIVGCCRTTSASRLRHWKQPRRGARCPHTPKTQRSTSHAEHSYGQNSIKRTYSGTGQNDDGSRLNVYKIIIGANHFTTEGGKIKHLPPPIKIRLDTKYWFK